MHRTINVIVYADGTIEPLEPVAVNSARRALLTILEEAPANGRPLADEDVQFDALLLAAGLQELPAEISDDLEPLSEDALDALWARISAGTPLSDIVIEDRKDPD